MSDQNESTPAVRSDEPELNDDALEQVSGGRRIGDPILPVIRLPGEPIPAGDI